MIGAKISLDDVKQFSSINWATLIYLYFFTFPFFSGFPIYYLNLGGKVVWFYYFPLVALAMLFFTSKVKLKIGFSVLVTFTGLGILVMFGTIRTFQVLPLYFLLSLYLFYFSISKKILPRVVWLKLFFILVLCFSYLQMLLPGSFDAFDRYIGFWLSPTTFGIYSMAIYILLFSSFGKKEKWVYYFMVLLLIILTKTRLNILFFLILPVAFYFCKKQYLKRLFIIAFTFFIILAYPVYNYISATSLGGQMVEMRYEDGRDASAQLRLFLFGTMLKEASTMKSYEVLIGKGAEHARNLIKKVYARDVQTHNDFMRLYIDFGIIFILGFWFVFYKISMANSISIMLFALYMLSFFHNMVYNYYIPVLIFISNEINSTNSNVAKTKD